MNEYERADEFERAEVQADMAELMDRAEEEAEMMRQPGAHAELIAKANAICDRLDVITEQRDKLADEEKFLRSRLAVLLPVGTSKVGARSVNIRENRRFDVGRAEQVLTPAERELCIVPVLNSKRAKEMLAPARYAECQVVAGDPVVRVS